LVERFQSRLTLTPSAPAPAANPRELAFAVLLDSYTQVDAILQADTAAAAGKAFYDDDYFEKFFVRVKPILDRQLGRAITATASVIVGRGRPRDGRRSAPKTRDRSSASGSRW